MGVLSSFNWKLRKHNMVVYLFNISLHNSFEEIGFELFKINKNNRYYSLLSFVIILPNLANRPKLRWWGDILFLREPVYNFYLHLKEDLLWKRSKNKIKIKINNFLIKLLKFIFND